MGCVGKRQWIVFSGRFDRSKREKPMSDDCEWQFFTVDSKKLRPGEYPPFSKIIAG
jgi:hypothetical protein